MDLANCSFIKMPEPKAVEAQPVGQETEAGSDSPGAPGSEDSSVKLPKLTGQAELDETLPGKSSSMVPKLPLPSPARVQKHMAEKLGILQQASPRFRTRSTMRELAENTGKQQGVHAFVDDGDLHEQTSALSNAFLLYGHRGHGYGC